jgi:hypothetical protein
LQSKIPSWMLVLPPSRFQKTMCWALELPGFGGRPHPGARASTPLDGQCFFLSATEVTRLPAEVERLTVLAEGNSAERTLAVKPPRGRNGNRSSLTLTAHKPDATFERALGGREPQNRSARAQQEVGVRVRARLQKLLKPIRGDLLGGSRVFENAVGMCLPIGIDETHAAELRRGGAVVDVAN